MGDLSRIRAKAFAADFVAYELVADNIIPFAEISQMAEYDQDRWGNWIKMRSPTHLEILNREVDAARRQYIKIGLMMEQISRDRLEVHRRLKFAIAALDAVTP